MEMRTWSGPNGPGRVARATSAQPYSYSAEERARNEADRMAMSRLEAKDKEGKSRVTLVQRQDEHGKTIKEDRGGSWITLA